jgi:predicted RNA binding protein YcfA (HicA-like mRNA interferase family)
MEHVLNQIVGMDCQAAKKALEEDGYALRVIRENGFHKIVTMDYRPERVNVSIDDGIITNVEKLG